MPVLVRVTSEKTRFTTQLGHWSLTFYVYFNERSRLWMFDLTDDTTGQALLLGHPFVLGQDFLRPYIFGIGHMFCYDSTGQHREAGVDDLGRRVPVAYFTPTEWELL